MQTYSEVNHRLQQVKKCISASTLGIIKSAPRSYTDAQIRDAVRPAEEEAIALIAPVVC